MSLLFLFDCVNTGSVMFSKYAKPRNSCIPCAQTTDKKDQFGHSNPSTLRRISDCPKT